MSDQVYQGAFPAVDLDNLYDSIIAELKARYPTFETVEFHRGWDGEDLKNLPLPAILLEDDSFEPVPDDNHGDEVTAVTVSFSAYVIISSVRNGNVRRQIRRIALDMAHFIDQHRWKDASGDGTRNLMTDPANVVVAERDAFNPVLDRAECWRVDWTQEIPVGESVWKGEDLVPDVLMVSYVPVIGLPHIGDYVELDKTQ